MSDLPSTALGVLDAVVRIGSALVEVAAFLIGLFFIAVGLFAVLRPQKLQAMIVEHILPFATWDPFRTFWRRPEYVIVLPFCGLLLLLLGVFIATSLIWR